jgi:energy-coupling factor transporter ATP-binding protein EcfA2
VIQTSAAQPLITEVTVEKLFGRHTYKLPFPRLPESGGRLVLLHGDNGSGKTTVLRLLWHTLSSAEKSGHRSYLSKTPFAALTIGLRGGQSICVRKAEGLVGTFTITLKRPDFEDVIVSYEASEDLTIPSARGLSTSRALLRARRNLEAHEANDGSLDIDWSEYEEEQRQDRLNSRAERAFLGFLVDEVRNPLYLADDRSLYSDDEDIQRTRAIVSRRSEVDRATPDVLSKLVFQELRVTLRRVNEYLRSSTLGGQNAGSAGSNSIYESLLRQLADQGDTPTQADVNTDESPRELLEVIAERSGDFELYGLVPRFDADLFAVLLGKITDPSRSRIANQVLGPYLSGLQARYDALEDAKNVLSTLIPTINAFFSSKQITFTPRDGIEIVSDDGEFLLVDSLSSGERQLLMLLCTTLLARDQTQLFIIDEPELSLGVEWQRKIIDALLKLTEGTEVQFLVATHSIEIISGAPDSLVLLTDES